MTQSLSILISNPISILNPLTDYSKDDRSAGEGSQPEVFLGEKKKKYMRA